MDTNSNNLNIKQNKNSQLLSNLETSSTSSPKLTFKNSEEYRNNNQLLISIKNKKQSTANSKYNINKENLLTHKRKHKEESDEVSQSTNNNKTNIILNNTNIKTTNPSRQVMFNLNKDQKNCKSKTEDSESVETKQKQRITWSLEEDNCLRFLIHDVGGKQNKINWTEIAEKMKIFKSEGMILTYRTGKQCRERWFNHLEKEINKKNWTAEEEKILFEKAKEFGNKWSEIAKYLNNRTDNCIKNHYYSSLRKKIRRLLKHLSNNKGDVEVNSKHSNNIKEHLKSNDFKTANTEEIYKVIKANNITHLDLEESLLSLIVLYLQKHSKRNMLEFSTCFLKDYNISSSSLTACSNSLKTNINTNNTNANNTINTFNTNTNNSTYSLNNKDKEEKVMEKKKINKIIINNNQTTGSNYNYEHNKDHTTGKIVNYPSNHAFYADNSSTIKTFNFEEISKDSSKKTNSKSNIPYFTTVVDNSNNPSHPNFQSNPNPAFNFNVVNNNLNIRGNSFNSGVKNTYSNSNYQNSVSPVKNITSTNNISKNSNNNNLNLNSNLNAFNLSTDIQELIGDQTINPFYPAAFYQNNKKKSNESFKFGFNNNTSFNNFINYTSNIFNSKNNTESFIYNKGYSKLNTALEIYQDKDTDPEKNLPLIEKPSMYFNFTGSTNKEGSHEKVKVENSVVENEALSKNKSILEGIKKATSVRIFL